MKKSISLLIAVAALSAFVACGSAEKKEAAPMSVSGKGMVKAMPKGAGFMIEAEGGKKYTVSNPDKLDKKLQKDKSKVEFTGNVMAGADGAESIEIVTAK